MKNSRLYVRNLRVLTMMAGIGLSGWSGIANSADISWNAEEDQFGYTVMVPRVNINNLVDDIVSVRGDLLRNEQQLAHDLEQKKITSKDTVLSLLLPGGLIYAAYKKSAYDSVVQKHEEVTIHIEELTTDIAALTEVSGPVQVANR